MKETSIEKTFCTTREAATLLGVSVGSVQVWVENGLLQAWKTKGGHRRVLRDSVDRLLHKKPPQTAGNSRPDAAPVGQPQLTVLVAEDDVSLLRLYSANISRWPMAPEVIALDNAVDALLMVGRLCPDLLILDLHMPGMDGFSMLRLLHRNPEVAKTTIVVVTGLDAAEIERRGGIPPGIEILPKPVPFDRLLSIATDLVKQGRIQTLTT